MQLSFLRVFDVPSGHALGKAKVLGAAIRVLLKHKDAGRLTMSYIQNVLEPAFSQHRAKIYYDEAGTPCGYVVWAMLAPTVEERVRSQNGFQLHRSEWNEGENFWIVDARFPQSACRQIFRDIFISEGEDISHINYLRRNRVHRLSITRFREIVEATLYQSEQRIFLPENKYG